MNRKDDRTKAETKARRNKRYYEKHKVRLLEKGKHYYQSNKKRLNERQKEYLKAYYNNNNLGAKISQSLRSRLSKLLSGKVKYSSVLNSLGCSKEDLVRYLEFQFTDGMCWENYGDWEIDHIRPCASYDLTNPQEQIACFHFTNLQPLWKSDNRSKKDKWDGK